MRPTKARISTLAAIAAASACLAASPAAGAAVTTYPAGGSHFDTGAEGWTPGATSCAPVGLLCSAESVYSSTTGNPPGSIAEQTNLTVNLVSLFEGTETWNSPQFTVQGGLVEAANLTLDRAFDQGSLAAVGPIANYTVTLHDLGTGTSQVLLTEGLDMTDSAFATENAPATVIGGHTYELSLEGTTGQSTLALSLLTGTTAIRFDNVGLQVQSAAEEGGGEGPGGGEEGGPGGGGGEEGSPGGGQGGPGGGEAGGGPGTGPGGNGASGSGAGTGSGTSGEAVGSSGVRVLGGPLSDAAISKLIGSTSVEAEVGHHPGGSLVYPSQCTIIGTPGPDHIVGTAGNDILCGLGGDDVITGLGGRDVIDGGSGNDRMIGGAGGDLLLGLAGKDQEIGSGGADRLGGGAGKDRLMGGAGNDMLVGRRGVDRLYGNGGNDLLKAHDGGRDIVNGGAGSDVESGDHADHPRGVEQMK